MKRILTSLLGLAALLTALPMRADHVTVSSKADFESAFVTKSNDQVDTIFVKSAGAWIAPTNGFDMPSKGTFHVIGVDDAETGEKSKLSVQFDMAANGEGDQVSIFFENLDMMCTGGRSANSKYFVNAKDTLYHYMDTLAFIGCEIYDYNRALFRIEPNPKTGRADGTASLGEIQCFILENCIIRDGYNQSNPYPFLNLSMPITDMIIRDNLFYNLAYFKSLFEFVNMTEYDNKSDMNFILENNTVIGRATSTFCNFGVFAGQMSNYQIHDNLFLYPNWKDDFNNLDITDSILELYPDTLDKLPGKAIASIMYGTGDISHNVLHGFKPASNYLDEEGQGEWAVEQHDNYSMADVEMDWTTFIDYKNHDFSYLSTEKLATAGVNGGPIGCTWLVKHLENPCYLTVTSTTEGVNFDPAKGVYEKGSEVTVTAIERPGAIFNHWEINSTNVSGENPYVFTIDGDVNLVAVFDEKPVAAVNITLDAPGEVVMSFEPVQDVYYVGDSVTVTFNPHYWADFDKWSDGVTEMNRGFRLTADVNLTASFKKSNRIAVWDFDQVTKGKQTLDNGVGANHFVNGDSAYIGALHTAYFVNGAYKDSATVMTRNNKFAGDIRICAVRETPADRFAVNPDYNYIVLNVAGYKDIGISSYVGADAKGHKKQLLQYSVDGLTWETFASTEMDSVGAWFELSGSLPAAAIVEDKICVRWIGDVSSDVIANPDNMSTIATVAEFSCVAGIVVKGASSVQKPANGYFVAVGEAIASGKQITSVEGIVMTYGGAADATWKSGEANIVLSAATDGLFEASTGGEGNNPVDENSKAFDKSGAGVPVSGTFYKFAPAQDGELEVAVVLNAGKKFFVAEDGVALPEYNGMTVEEKYNGTYKFNVKGGSIYYVFCTGSKLGFGGFIYNAATALDRKEITSVSFYTNGSDLFVTLPQAETITVVNLLGQTVRTVECTEGENVITGLTGGIYLLRMGTQVIKVRL